MGYEVLPALSFRWVQVSLDYISEPHRPASDLVSVLESIPEDWTTSTSDSCQIFWEIKVISIRQSGRKLSDGYLERPEKRLAWRRHSLSTQLASVGKGRHWYWHCSRGLLLSGYLEWNLSLSWVRTLFRAIIFFWQTANLSLSYWSLKRIRAR